MSSLTNKYLFSVNDIVLMDADSNFRSSPLIGVVANMLFEQSDLIEVHYWNGQNWYEGRDGGYTHYTRITWIGNLERFGLTWKDLK